MKIGGCRAESVCAGDGVGVHRTAGEDLIGREGGHELLEWHAGLVQALRRPTANRSSPKACPVLSDCGKTSV